MESSRVRVEGAPTRCPYCHDEAGAEDSVACVSCLARHYATCWEEGARCAACGHGGRLERSSGRPAEPAPRPQDLVTTLDVLRAVLPGAFLLRTAVPTLLALCMVIPLVVHMENMHSLFNVRRVLVGIPTFALWAQAAGWIVTGELKRLDTVLAELAGARWFLFLLAWLIPLWVIWAAAGR